jgi:hypothetical protein
MAGALFCALAAACSGGAGEERALPAQLDAPAAEAGLAPAAAVLVPADAPTVVFLADQHRRRPAPLPGPGLPGRAPAPPRGRRSALPPGQRQPERPHERGGATALAWTLRSKPTCS